MKERPLSASSIKTYLQCVLQYYFRYEDKKPRSGKTDPLSFGTALHFALEQLHKEVSETGEKPSPEMYTRIVDIFMRSAADNGLSKLSTYSEGRDIIISRLDSIDPTEKVLGLELKFELKTPAGTPFTGSIDKLIELDETTVAIIDYKSSKVALTQEEADEDVQLSMYDLAVSLLYPQYTTIVCALDYLRLGEVVTHRTPEQRAVFVQFLDAIYKSICEMKKEDIKPNLNIFCGWCDFKSYCPDFKAMVEDPDMILPRPDLMNDDEFIDAWRIFEAAKKIVDSRSREFKEEAYLRLSDQDVVKGKDLELYKVQQGMKIYNSRSVFNVVGTEIFVGMASVGKKSLERYMRDNPDHVGAIEGASTFAFQAPSFRLRKVRAEE